MNEKEFIELVIGLNLDIISSIMDKNGCISRHRTKYLNLKKLYNFFKDEND